MSAWTASEADTLRALYVEAAEPRPARRPREPLWAGGAAVGSLEPALFDGVALPAGLLLREEAATGARWIVQGDVTTGLAHVADALRAAGRASRWRDELLPVIDADGRRLGAVERGVTRSLGIATQAVHLLGTHPDGRMWVQQRAFDKANDPGRWDTLMGGMVPASDTLAEALARETWEEAGLDVGLLGDLTPQGSVTFGLPCDEEWGGYIVERIDWFSAVVPAGVEPDNRDGEVAGFELLDRAMLLRRLQDHAFTWAAQALLAAYLLRV